LPRADVPEHPARDFLAPNFRSFLATIRSTWSLNYTMKKTLLKLTCHSALLALCTLTANAQRPEGGGGEGRGPEGRGGAMRISPLMQALDADKDGSISEAEMKNAAAALKALDKNGDGKLSPEELRPPSREGEGREGNRAGGDEMVTRLMQMDKNGDGKLTKDELPERMAGMLTRGDTDKDGALSKEEIAKLAATTGGGGREGGREGGEGRERERGEHREDDDDRGERKPAAPPAPAPPVAAPEKPAPAAPAAAK
jgi:hypothetical protein